MEKERFITIGIPASPKACETLPRLYASLLIQSQLDKLQVMVCLDGPDCDEKQFKKIADRFPEIPTKFVSNKINGGPGVSVDTIIEKCETPWVTFMDADDTLADMVSMEQLMVAVKPSTVCVESIFLGETDFEDCMKAGGQIPRFRPYNNAGFSPWRFGRLWNVEFMRKNNICSTSLRTMEDSVLAKSVHMLCDGTQFTIEQVNAPTYVWRSQPNSITRAGIDSNPKHEPYYNRWICPTGAVLSSINAVRNVKKRNPFNGGIIRHCADTFVQTYFSYIENSNRDEASSDINWFNAKLAYHELYKMIEDDISDDILKDIWTMHNVGSAQSLVGIMPQLTWAQFLEKIKSEPYNGNSEYIEIIKKFPRDVIEKCSSSGVLNIEEGIEKFIVEDNKGVKLHPTTK